MNNKVGKGKTSSENFVCSNASNFATSLEVFFFMLYNACIKNFDYFKGNTKITEKELLVKFTEAEADK